jgi:hypothetical protein
MTMPKEKIHSEVHYEIMVGMQWSPVPARIGSHNSTNTLSKAVRIRSHMNPLSVPPSLTKCLAQAIIFLLQSEIIGISKERVSCRVALRQDSLQARNNRHHHPYHTYKNYTKLT